MKIAVMGSGGLGGYFGGLLARNGNDVTFIARGEHLRALRTRGLAVRSVNGDFALESVSATDDPSQVGVVDWVLFTVKTYDTETAIAAMASLVGADTTVVTLQNGVESFDQLAARFGGERVIVAPTQITAAISEPGTIVQDSTFRNMTVGEIGGAITPRVEWLVEQFARNGVNAVISDQMPVPLWLKWEFLAPMAGLTSLARTEAAELFKSENARAILRRGIQECNDVALASGVNMPPDAVERQSNLLLGFKPGNLASMHRDLLAGRRLELEALSGAAVRLGAARGVDTPVNATIYAGLAPFAGGANRKMH